MSVELEKSKKKGQDLSDADANTKDSDSKKEEVISLGKLLRKKGDEQVEKESITLEK